jgi:hypothetical protein
MNKKYFAIKLLPSRPDFAQTMTDHERDIMQQHIVYWKEFMQKGIMIVFGPVLDPNGVYGLGIIAVDSEDQVSGLLDMTLLLKLTGYEYYPMMAVADDK